MTPTQRFSNRVADYIRYRPSYPRELLTDLRGMGALASTSVIADIGSGTGLLTQLFLEAGHSVFGVEPNPEMRQAGEAQLASFSNFTSINGTAEATTLANHGIDLIIAGQAFHWFDPPRARAEFARILRPPGWTSLIWNERLVDISPFLAGYEALLHEFATDYAQVDHRHITDDRIAAFFHPNSFTQNTYPNHQHFGYQALKGRLLSSSYAPPPGHPNHAPMLQALQHLFNQHQESGQVTFEYTTRVYTGRSPLL